MLPEKKKELSDYGKEAQEFKKPKSFKVWNFLIYGGLISIGVFLVYLYSSYIFINKWNKYIGWLSPPEYLAFYCLVGLLLLLLEWTIIKSSYHLKWKISLIIFFVCRHFLISLWNYQIIKYIPLGLNLKKINFTFPTLNFQKDKIQ